MNITKFKNGNFNVKADESNIENNLICDIYNSREVDFGIISDWCSLDNSAMYIELYNCSTGLAYCITDTMYSIYKGGKMIKLVGYKLSKEEQREVEKWI